MSPLYSKLKNKPSKNQHEEDSQQSLAYFSTLKIEASCSSETSVEFELTAQRYK
jgi:hypothetical protein